MLQSYVEDDAFTEDWEIMYMTNSAVATWKESIDLATLASRLSKERVQLDTPDKDRESTLR